MPSAQPDPASKPPRKAAKPKTVAKSAASELSIGDLLTELSFLKGLISGLQQEVFELKKAGSVRPLADHSHHHLPLQIHEEEEREDEEPVQPEPSWVLAGSQELTSQEMELAMGAMAAIPDEEPDILHFQQNQQSGHPDEEEQEDYGTFAPFEPGSFAEDFAAAFESPVPIDWGKWAAEEEEDEVLSAQSRLESAKTDGDALQEMIKRHSGLVEGVIQFNIETPPDFLVDSPFNEAVEKLGLVKAAEAKPLGAPANALQPVQTAHDIMAELVAEASAAPAVPASGFEEPLDLPVLSGFPSDFSDNSTSLGKGASGLEDLSFAPPTGSPSTRSRYVNPETLAHVPALEAIRACVLPLMLADGQLTAGAPKPYDQEAIQSFEEATGLKVILQPMAIQDVIEGLREGYSTRDGDDFRSSLLSGAAPSMPMTLLERALSLIPFLQRTP